jgi:sugar (pentulose or hexulose) kinase
MGYDLIDFKWPSFIESQLGIPISKLPRVVSPGDVVGNVRPQIAQELGLPPNCEVVAGCTDGTASFLASGATHPGDVSCALGTTLVVRSISYQLIKDPEGRITAIATLKVIGYQGSEQHRRRVFRGIFPRGELPDVG